MKNNAFNDVVPVNFGKLLEDQLMKWRGGGRHTNGIGEYISNSDDSYRRLEKVTGQKIEIEVHSKRGRHIDSLIIKDYAEGMSYDNLQEKFFKYFESASGREKGAKVTGRFGTGGKAYAIMNFKHCWITSVQNNIETKAWFKWDERRKEIIRNYNQGGYKNKKVNKQNQTIIELKDSIKVNLDLLVVVANLETLARIRHVLRYQSVSTKLFKQGQIHNLGLLKYHEPKDEVKTWSFTAPQELLKDKREQAILTLKYFEKPLGKDNFIDLSDGISSVADLDVSKYDGRPFSKYLNGSLELQILQDSAAVRENRKGLEDGDDLTETIEKFIQDCVYEVVSEIEETQRKKERDRRFAASQEKMKELSKFLKKCDMRFRFELKELKKRIKVDVTKTSVGENEPDEIKQLYRKPTSDDSPGSLISGRWVVGSGIFDGDGTGSKGVPKFIPEANGPDKAVAIGQQKISESGSQKKREGLRVCLSDDQNIPESERPVFGEYDDPVSDKDMEAKGIVWINANHPLILTMRQKSDNDPVFLEMVANYVLMVVAQYHAQKQYDSEPEDEKSDPILLFRGKFFKFQRELREDSEISYFNEYSAANQEVFAQTDKEVSPLVAEVKV